jgi:acetylxylan esterase
MVCWLWSHNLIRRRTNLHPVVAAAVFGPTVRSAGQNYTVKGGRDFNGTSPRTQEATEGLKPYTGILREWCNKGDPICAKGSEPSNVEFHLDYFFKYTEEASKWIIQTTKTGKNANVEEASPSASPSASKSHASSSSTASPTGARAATTPSSTPSRAAQHDTSFGVPKIELARGTWALCGAVIFGSLFFLS